MKTVVTLRLKQSPDLPVEAEKVNPSSVAGKTLDTILALPLLYGNRDACVGEFFTGETASARGEGIRLVLQGDLSRFKHIGRAMDGGELVIDGSTGFHTGAAMRAGMLTVNGDTGDWLGAHMEGGRIVVNGNAGHFIGAAYRGKTQGMRGGTILIHGNAGQMAGAKMRRGTIAVSGNCLDAPGYHMNAGTLLLKGSAGRRIGTGMRRGTIILFSTAELMPTFYRSCDYRPAFLRVLYGELRRCGFPIEPERIDAPCTRCSGDAIAGGKGEILLYT